MTPLERLLDRLFRRRCTCGQYRLARHDVVSLDGVRHRRDRPCIQTRANGDRLHSS